MRSPQTHIFSDLQSGTLPAISWVIPTWENSDHAGNDSTTGPSWVTQVVDAIGQSKYWKSTAIFILWDDYGGWYDHVAPKKVDYDGLGMRLPLIIISPYAKKGYVSHVPYEHGSILRFIEDQFGLGRLAASDTRATSPAADCFDFTKPPRTFNPFKSKYDRAFFLHQPLSRHPVDDK
jgi:phospholipase C